MHSRAALPMMAHRDRVFRAIESLPPRDRMYAGVVLAFLGLLLVTLFVMRNWQPQQWKRLLLFWVALGQIPIFAIGLPLANPYLALMPRGYEVLAAFGSLVLAGVVIKAITRRSRTSPEAAARCGQCGYNLTGNTSGVCPECGERI